MVMNSTKSFKLTVTKSSTLNLPHTSLRPIMLHLFFQPITRLPCWPIRPLPRSPISIPQILLCWPIIVPHATHYWMITILWITRSIIRRINRYWPIKNFPPRPRWEIIRRILPAWSRRRRRIPADIPAICPEKTHQPEIWWVDWGRSPLEVTFPIWVAKLSLKVKIIPVAMVNYVVCIFEVNCNLWYINGMTNLVSVGWLLLTERSGEVDLIALACMHISGERRMKTHEMAGMQIGFWESADVVRCSWPLSQ